MSQTPLNEKPVPDEVAHFLRTNLIRKIGIWQQGLSEIQTQIRQEIFRTREVEQDEKHLARLDMLLRQQPGWRGIDIDLDGDIPDFLLATKMPPFVVNIDVSDIDADIQKEMASIAASLPEKPIVVDTSPPKKYKRIIKEKVEPVSTPGLDALLKLIQAIKTSDKDIGLAQWREADLDAMTMEPHVWISFSVMALRSDGIKVDLILDPPRQGEKFSQTFTDAVARCVKKKSLQPYTKQAN